MPFGKEMSAVALEWAGAAGRYTSGEMTEALASAFRLTPEQRSRRLRGGQVAFDNYVDWLLAAWSREGVHSKVPGDRGCYVLAGRSPGVSPKVPVQPAAGGAPRGTAGPPTSQRATAREDSLAGVPGITGDLLARLRDAGVGSRDDLGDLSSEELLDIAPELPRHQAEALVMEARRLWFA